MLSLSQTTGYAIKALACLPGVGAPPRLIAEVARCTRIPRAYLAKIVNHLVRQGLVTARRGHHGGIALARPAEQITLLDIVEAVEGPNWLGHCLLGMEECRNQQECPTLGFWMKVCQQIREQLGSTSLASVITAIPNRPSCDSHDTRQAIAPNNPARRPATRARAARGAEMKASRAP